MEIKLSTSSVSKPEPVKPVSRQESAQQMDGASFQQAQALENKLKEIPVVRPEQVDHARTLLASDDYPPDAVLKSLATLLAMKMK